MTAPWQLDFLWGIVNGLATGAIAIPLAAIIANRWFVERRGLVTGVLTASSATGQLIFLPVLAAIVTHWGWRYASLTVSLVALGVVLPLVALFMRDRPADIGLMPFGATEPDPPPARGRQPVRGGDRRPAHGPDEPGVLAARRQLLHLRALDQRPDRDASHPGRDGSRARRGGRREPARDDRRLRHRRDDVLRLADRSLRPAPPALLVLRPARAEPARPAVRVRLAALRTDPLRRLLRPRLDRDRARRPWR